MKVLGTGQVYVDTACGAYTHSSDEKVESQGCPEERGELVGMFF